jgi:membrane protease YdiL (CAAX protease family)
MRPEGSTRLALPALGALAVVLAGYLMMGVGAWLGRTVGIRAVLIASELLLALPALAALAVHRVSLADGVGLRPVASRASLASLALGGTLWALSLGLFELQYTLWRPPVGYLEQFQQLHELLEPSGPLDAFVSLTAIAIAPALCEELVFRGAVLPAFLRLGAPAAAALSSLLFGVIHLDFGGGVHSLSRVPFAFVVGLALAAIRLRTGALGPAILAHATLNGITFGAAPLAGPFDGSLPDARPLLGAALFLGGLLASALVFLKALPALTPRRADP